MSVAKTSRCSAEQTRISDSGAIETQPLTWDGEPVYSAETVREGLFDPEPFKQIPGQLAIDAEAGER